MCFFWFVLGHYIPQLSEAIVKHNQGSDKNSINLKGYMVSLSSYRSLYD